jgi:hypothetical protein
MGVAWNILHYLEFVCNANFRAAGFFEQPVVMPLSIADAVAVFGKYNSRDEKEINVLRLDFREMGVRFQDIEFSFGRMFKVFDGVELQRFSFHSRKDEGFPAAAVQEVGDIHLPVDGKVKRHGFCSSESRQSFDFPQYLAVFDLSLFGMMLLPFKEFFRAESWFHVEEGE